MNKKLKDIAEVIPGYTLRASIGSFEPGDIRVIQAKDISTIGTIEYSALPQITILGFKGSAYIQKGDIVLGARGNFRAAVCEFTEEGVVASSSVFIIRPLSSEVSHQYLAIFLNSSAGQQALERESTGSVMKTLLRRNLEGVEIQIPSRHQQDSAVRLNLTWQKMESLRERRQTLQQGVVQQLTNKIITS